MKTPRSDSIRVRFAPAPTGSLHVGGARTALYNYLFARRNNGAFILRSEDTDLGRSSLESERTIQAELRWLGLSWDEGTDIGGDYGPYRQTDRTDRYGLAAARLLETEQAYQCYCTPEELEAERKAAERVGIAPRYSGKCRELTRAQRVELEAQGRIPALRFIMPERDIYVEDLVRGSVHFPAGSIGDFVIMKSDGTPAYNFAAVVDDSDMAISHVIRGDEHLPNTPRQVALYEALERPLPLFAHVSMILAPDHQKLSKRHGATSLAEYRDQGFLPAALVNYLAMLGWSTGDDRELFTLDELMREFSLERVHKAAAVFDHAKLRWYNAHYLRGLSKAERADLFVTWAARDSAVAEAPELSDPLWVSLFADAMTDHVEVLGQLPALAAEVLRDEVVLEPGSESELEGSATRAMLEELANTAQRSSDRTTLMAATSKEALLQLGSRHGLKGHSLFMPIRIAATGQERGVELAILLPLLGPQRLAKRIQCALSIVMPRA